MLQFGNITTKSHWDKSMIRGTTQTYSRAKRKPIFFLQGEKKMTTAEAIKQAFDSYAIGARFRGWEFKKKVTEFRPEVRTMYTDTILRQLRKFYHGRYKVVGPYGQSLYEKTS